MIHAALRQLGYALHGHYLGLALDLYTVLIPLSGYASWFWITGDPFLA